LALASSFLALQSVQIFYSSLYGWTQAILLFWLRSNDAMCRRREKLPGRLCTAHRRDDCTLGSSPTPRCCCACSKRAVRTGARWRLHQAFDMRAVAAWPRPTTGAETQAEGSPRTPPGPLVASTQRGWSRRAGRASLRKTTSSVDTSVAATTAGATWQQAQQVQTGLPEQKEHADRAVPLSLDTCA